MQDLITLLRPLRILLFPGWFCGFQMLLGIALLGQEPVHRDQQQTQISTDPFAFLRALMKSGKYDDAAFYLRHFRLPDHTPTQRDSLLHYRQLLAYYRQDYARMLQLPQPETEAPLRIWVLKAYACLQLSRWTQLNTLSLQLQKVPGRQGGYWSAYFLRARALMQSRSVVERGLPESLPDRWSGPFEQLARYEQQHNQWNPKSPWVAGLLSAAVPGLGKVYLNRPWQGLAAFTLVSLWAIQAWEGYRREGMRSIRFYVFAGVGLAFYVGNIWGSIAGVFSRRNQYHDALHQNLLRGLGPPLLDVVDRGTNSP